MNIAITEKTTKRRSEREAKQTIVPEVYDEVMSQIDENSRTK